MAFVFITSPKSRARQLLCWFRDSTCPSFSGFSWPHDCQMAATAPGITPVFKAGRGRRGASHKCTFIRKATSFSEAVKRFLLGLIGLDLVRWPGLPAEEAGKVATQLFQLPKCQLDLPPDRVHHSSPLLSRIPWATGPEMPVSWTRFALCLAWRELFAVQVWKQRCGVRTGLHCGRRAESGTAKARARSPASLCG